MGSCSLKQPQNQQNIKVKKLYSCEKQNQETQNIRQPPLQTNNENIRLNTASEECDIQEKIYQLQITKTEPLTFQSKNSFAMHSKDGLEININQSMSGYGMISFKDGSQYEGYFQEGLIHGFGRFTDIDIEDYCKYFSHQNDEKYKLLYLNIFLLKNQKIQFYQFQLFNCNNMYSSCRKKALLYIYSSKVFKFHINCQKIKSNYFYNIYLYLIKLNLIHDFSTHAQYDFHQFIIQYNNQIYRLLIYVKQVQNIFVLYFKHPFSHYLNCYSYILVNGFKIKNKALARKQQQVSKPFIIDQYLYQGQFFNNFKHGKGYAQYQDGTSYEGQFQYNQLHGFGVYKGLNGLSYVGNWVDNSMDGQGKLTLSNRSVYEGSFRQNKKHGYGVYTWADGKQYKGYWKNDAQDGEGELVKQDGQPIQRKYQNGKRIASNLKILSPISFD